MISKHKLDNIVSYMANEGRALGIDNALLSRISMETAADIRITFPGHTSQLELIRRVTKQIAALAPSFSEEELEDIGLAIDEACTNVINHSYGGGKTGSIQVEMKIEPHKFTVMLTDMGSEGQMFNPETLSPPDREEYLRNLTKGGLGVFLIKKIMDEVEYTVAPGVKNCLTMVKYCYPRKTDNTPCYIV